MYSFKEKTQRDKKRANALTVLPNKKIVNALEINGKLFYTTREIQSCGRYNVKQYDVVYGPGDFVIVERSNGYDGTNYATRQIGIILTKDEMNQWDKDVDIYGYGYIYHILLCGKEHLGAIIDARYEDLRGLVRESDLSHYEQDALFDHCLNTWKENPEDNTELIVDKFPQQHVLNHCGKIKKKYFEEFIESARIRRAPKKAEIFWGNFKKN